MNTTSVPSVTPAPSGRDAIDQLDADIIRLIRTRTLVSQSIGAARVASGGPRRVLAREQVIVERYEDALGTEGVELASLLLRLGRGLV